MAILTQDPYYLGDDFKIVLMNGGLGNQICQYIFLRWLEINTGKKCLADDSAFCLAKPEHNGYEHLLEDRHKITGA